MNEDSGAKGIFLALSILVGISPVGGYISGILPE